MCSGAVPAPTPCANVTATSELRSVRVVAQIRKDRRHPSAPYLLDAERRTRLLSPVAFSATELLAPPSGNTASSVHAGWAAHRESGLVATFAGLAATLPWSYAAGRGQR